MSELLLELGCEELPATFVRKAYQDLQDLVLAGLREADLLEPTSASQAFGTPRRLIVGITGLKERQPDQVKEQRGPAIKAAYDAEGKPTPAVLGFCRGAGIQPGDLRKDDQYVWATKKTAGRTGAEILAEALPKAIRSLSFEKSMRWGKARMRFARPIRWILASLDGNVVSFEVEGVISGSKSRGHRFYSPDEFEALDLQDLLNKLRSRTVEADPEKRRAMILSETEKSAGGEAIMPEALIEENVFLTEWPSAVQGEFRADFLELPAPVLTTAMAKHEKMFPVRAPDGNLTNRFVFIRNSGEDSTVRAGSEWVLNARFNDAKFFFDEDRKHDLDHFLDKTAGIVFHNQLGSIRQRADRLSALAAFIAEKTGAPKAEVEWAREAGRLAKADLSTGLVSELPGLQGVIGGEYARREGKDDPVCWAVASHYDLSKNQRPDCEGARTAVRLVMADQIDRLAGYLGKGMAPSGSSDPFALRRAATMLIEAAWGWPSALSSFEWWLNKAAILYATQGIELDANHALEHAIGLFGSRYESLLPEARHDVLEAATSVGTLDPRGVRLRVETLEALAADQAFVFAATRPINIVGAARKKNIVFGSDLSSMQSQEGEQLLKVSEVASGQARQAMEGEDASALGGALKPLVGPIDAFFESTMVMVEDESVRNSRLALLDKVSQLMFLAGDLGKIVIAEQ